MDAVWTMTPRCPSLPVVVGERGGSEPGEVEGPDHVQFEVGQQDALRHHRAVGANEGRALGDGIVVVALTGECCDVTSEFGDERRGPLGVRIQHHDADAESGKVANGRPTEPSCAAGDDRGPGLRAASACVRESLDHRCERVGPGLDRRREVADAEGGPRLDELLADLVERADRDDR